MTGNNKKAFLKVCVLLLFIMLIPLGAIGNDSLLPEIRGILKDRYVEDLSPEQLQGTTPEGLIKSLEDPYTSYFTPEEFRRYLEVLNNSFVGIGVTFRTDPLGAYVVRVIENSPALAAGIRQEDILISANGTSLAGLNSDQIVGLITGREGTRVVLELLRGQEVLRMSLVRQRIQIPYVQGQIYDGNTGYIRVSSFGPEVGQLFGKEILTLREAGATSWIIDLRDNGGGYFQGALEILGYFYRDPVGIPTQTGQSDQQTIYLTNRQRFWLEGNVILLVNEYTVSASEIVAAAVKDYERGLILGKKTFGKGSMQSFYTLSNGGMLKVTEERFFSPKGNPIDKVGITPWLVLPEREVLGAARLLSGTTESRVFIEKGSRKYFVNMELAMNPEFLSPYLSLIDAMENKESRALTVKISAEVSNLLERYKKAS